MYLKYLDDADADHESDTEDSPRKYGGPRPKRIIDESLENLQPVLAHLSIQVYGPDSNKIRVELPNPTESSGTTTMEKFKTRMDLLLDVFHAVWSKLENLKHLSGAAWPFGFSSVNDVLGETETIRTRVETGTKIFPDCEPLLHRATSKPARLLFSEPSPTDYSRCVVREHLRARLLAADSGYVKKVYYLRREPVLRLFGFKITGEAPAQVSSLIANRSRSAARFGVEIGQYLYAVNNIVVFQFTHEATVREIFRIPSRMRLTVLTRQ